MEGSGRKLASIGKYEVCVFGFVPDEDYNKSAKFSFGRMLHVRIA